MLIMAIGTRTSKKNIIYESRERREREREDSIQILLPFEFAPSFVEIDCLFCSIVREKKKIMFVLRFRE
jgi:hypothetical protein